VTTTHHQDEGAMPAPELLDRPGGDD